MTFKEAAARQHLYSTFYTVWLVSPEGTREQIGTTQRKSGSGLIAVLRRESVQSRIAQLPEAETTKLRKRADRLEFTNGWKIVFGGTIRQEAERE